MISTRRTRRPRLETVCRRLDRWRRRRPRARAPLPPRLWAAAVELVPAHGLYGTARALHLDYGTLKRHVEGTGDQRNRPFDNRLCASQNPCESTGPPRSVVPIGTVELSCALYEKSRTSPGARAATSHATVWKPGPLGIDGGVEETKLKDAVSRYSTNVPLASMLPPLPTTMKYSTVRPGTAWVPTLRIVTSGLPPSTIVKGSAATVESPVGLTTATVNRRGACPRRSKVVRRRLVDLTNVFWPFTITVSPSMSLASV
jgi:hypothetical protein